MAARNMTQAQTEALDWLKKHGGDGVFAEKNRQVLLAAGERAPVMRSTWTGLCELGLVEVYGNRRLRLTAEGAK